MCKIKTVDFNLFGLKVSSSHNLFIKLFVFGDIGVQARRETVNYGAQLRISFVFCRDLELINFTLLPVRDGHLHNDVLVE